MIWIRNGRVVDGSGAPERTGDVLIDGDRIAEVGRLPPGRVDERDPALEIIDAAGKVVCPGFIDMHAHSDFSIPVGGGPMSEKLRQGVTTAVIGSCGLSAAPVNPRAVKFYRRFTAGMFGTECPFRWNSVGEYIRYLTEAGHAGNVVVQVGLGNLRLMVRGLLPGRPTAGQMKRMKETLARSLDEGARGFSTGLIYPPQKWTSREEIAELVGVLAGREEAIYSTHVRDEADRVEEAMREALDTARGAGVSLQISHHKAVFERNHGRVHKTMELLSRAREQGLDVETDVYPYNAFSNIILPFIFRYEPGLERSILFLSMKHHKDLEGKTLAEAAAARRRDPRLLILSLALREGVSGMPIAGFMMSEDDVRFLLAHPLASIGSDGNECFGRRSHPRLYGTHARFIETYIVRERVVSLEEGVRKMTGMVAAKLRLKDRGLVRKGYHADLAVFDPENVRENTTYQDPVHYPTGFDAVIVNGRVAVRSDVQTPARAGRVL